jgi:hypothetical protein
MRDILRLLSRARGAHGAVSIEAIALVFVLLAGLLLFMLIGSAYWNLTLLNSTAQSTSLAKQSVMDRYCSYQVQTRCAEGQARAAAVTAQILGDAQNSMISLSDTPAACSGVSYGKICDEGRIQAANATSANSGQLPDRYGNLTQPAMAGGWSWSYTNLKTNFDALGVGVLPMRSSALSMSYKDPNR